MYGCDQLIGKCVLFVSLSFSLYYIVWVVSLPFMDEDSFLRALFPDPIYAIVGPTVVFVALLMLNGAYMMQALFKAQKIKAQ